MKKYLQILLIIMLIFVSVISCNKKKSDSIIFATDATWPPLEYIDENGNLTGFEVELISMIGDAVDAKFEAKNVPWKTIFAGLNNGAYQGIASGVTVTEERKNVMDFSNPILNAGQIVIIKNTDSNKFKNINDLEGFKVGVQIGSTGDLSLDDYNIVKKQYDDIAFALMDMENNNLEGVVCDSLIASDFVLANEKYKGKFTIAGTPFTTEDIAICVKKGDSKLLNQINKGLEVLKENGELSKLKAKWNIL